MRSESASDPVPVDKDFTGLSAAHMVGLSCISAITGMLIAGCFHLLPPYPLGHRDLHRAEIDHRRNVYSVCLRHPARFRANALWFVFGALIASLVRDWFGTYDGIC